MSSPKEGQEIEQEYTHTQEWMERRKGQEQTHHNILALLNHSQSYTLASYLE